ncbi:MAG TPA: hypothetical protein VE869_03255 [Gemmatimonas sp.]|nr:hypothetical protein [Gemmatimonas sp.]
MYRRLSVVAAALLAVACGSKETPATDSATAAAAAAPEAAAAPAMTLASIGGTWNGQSMAETGDSVTARFTAIGDGSGNGKFVSEGSKDTVMFTITIDGDSSISISKPYKDATMPKGTPDVMWRSIGRMSGDKLVGTSAIMLAAKPDSVIGRGRWEATRAP